MELKLNYDREKERESHIKYLRNRCVMLTDYKSNEIRKKFIECFVNTTSDYFKKNINQKIKEGKREFYEGFLWDNLIVYNRMEKTEDLSFLNNLENKEVYVMSDLHSLERLGNAEFLLPFFPVENIISAKLNNILLSLAALSQDTYIFDNSFSWYLILTHESDDLGPEIYFYRE